MSTPNATWTDMVAAHARSERPAVISPSSMWSHADLWDSAANWSGWMEVNGVPPGKPVPLLVGSSASAYALLLAGALANRPMAPLGDRLPVNELAACVEAIGGGVILAHEQFASLAREVADRSNARVLLLPDEPRAASDFRPAPVPAEQTVFVFHTSGTTGRPKAVHFPNGRMGARARVYADLLELRPGDVYSSSQQFHHLGGGGLLAVALAVGASVLPPTSRFTLDGWRQLGELGATHATLAPTMIERLLRSGDLAFPSLRMIVYGSSPIRQATAARLVQEHPRLGIFQGYSQTEGGPITALTPTDHRLAAGSAPDLLTSVGRPVAGLDLDIVGADATGVGEVWARGEHLVAPAPDGWLHTGDLGRIGADGYLYLVGRKGDMIIRGGENVYPDEVERRIQRHPAVREVAVVGLPDDEYGEEVVAFVIPAGDPATFPRDEVRGFVRDTLAGFKVPTQWRLVDALPRGGLGKVLRRQLRES